MGDEWLVDENIDVDIQQLQDFAKRIREELEVNFQPSLENGIRPMLMVQAPFGGGGLAEGKFFRGRHDESRSAAAQLLGEVMRGMAALSTAAMSISAEYLTGDALAQATNEDVLEAFSTVDGQNTLNDYWQQGDGTEQDPANTVPTEATDPNQYFGDEADGSTGGTSTGETPAIYQEHVVAEGEAGEYRIDGDQQDMHNPRYDLPEYEH